MKKCDTPPPPGATAVPGVEPAMTAPPWEPTEEQVGEWWEKSGRHTYWSNILGDIRKAALGVARLAAKHGYEARLLEEHAALSPRKDKLAAAEQRGYERRVAEERAILHEYLRRHGVGLGGEDVYRLVIEDNERMRVEILERELAWDALCQCEYIDESDIEDAIRAGREGAREEVDQP